MDAPRRRETRAGRKGTRTGGGSAGSAVDDADGGPAAGPAQDELRRPVGAHARQAVLLALLEAQAGLAAQRVAEGGPPDADRVEDGRLDDHALVVASETSLAAPPMTPAMASGPAGVGDEQRLGVELALDVVERLEALPGHGAAHDDAAVGDGRGVERVDRLAELEHARSCWRRRRCEMGRTPAAMRRRWTSQGEGPTVTPSR